VRAVFVQHFCQRNNVFTPIPCHIYGRFRDAASNNREFYRALIALTVFIQPTTRDREIVSAILADPRSRIHIMISLQII